MFCSDVVHADSSLCVRIADNLVLAYAGGVACCRTREIFADSLCALGSKFSRTLRQQGEQESILEEKLKIEK